MESFVSEIGGIGGTIAVLWYAVKSIKAELSKHSQKLDKIDDRITTERDKLQSSINKVETALHSRVTKVEADFNTKLNNGIREQIAKMRVHIGQIFTKLGMKERHDN